MNASDDTLDKLPIQIMTPETVISLNLRRLNGLPEFNQMVRIRGYYSTPTELNGYALAWLNGQNNKTQIRLYFTERENNMKFFNYLEEGREYVFTGYLSLYNNKENLCLQLTPDDVDMDKGADRSTTSQWGQDTLKIKEWLCYKKQHKTKDMLQVIRQVMNKRSHATAILVRPKSEIAQNDMMAALGEAKDFYVIKPYECDSTNPASIAQKLKRADQTIADFIIFSRGGGNLEAIDDMQVLEALSNMTKPLVTGLGHNDDHLLAEMFADHICETPTMVGVYLNRLYKEAIEEKEQYATFEHEAQEIEVDQIKKAFGSYMNPKHTFYGIRWTDLKLIRWFIWMLCLIGMYQVVKLFI